MRKVFGLQPILAEKIITSWLNLAFFDPLAPPQSIISQASKTVPWAGAGAWRSATAMARFFLRRGGNSL